MTKRVPGVTSSRGGRSTNEALGLHRTPGSARLTRTPNTRTTISRSFDTERVPGNWTTSIKSMVSSFKVASEVPNSSTNVDIQFTLDLDHIGVECRAFAAHVTLGDEICCTAAIVRTSGRTFD